MWHCKKRSDIPKPVAGEVSLPELNAFWKLPPAPCVAKREKFCSPFRLIGDQYNFSSSR